LREKSVQNKAQNGRANEQKYARGKTAHFHPFLSDFSARGIKKKEIWPI